MGCAVTFDLDRHLANEERAEARAEAINDRIEDIIADAEFMGSMDASNEMESCVASILIRVAAGDKDGVFALANQLRELVVNDDWVQKEAERRLGKPRY